MEEIRLRPVFHKYAVFWAGLMAALALIALIAIALAPGSATLVSAFALILGALMIFKVLERYYLRITTEYVVNDDEIIEISGLWAKDEVHIPVGKVEDYTIDRSVLGKFLGVASISIQTAGAEKGPEMMLRAIPEKEVAKLDQLRGRLKRK